MHLISEHSLMWLLPIAFLAGVLSWFLYQRKGWLSEISISKLWVLRSLRFTTLFLFGILLLGIILQTFSSRKEKPVFVTLIDNSSSMLNYSDQSNIANWTNAFRTQLKEKYGDKFELVQLTVGSSVDAKNPDFKESSSALEQGFEKIHVDYYNRNVGGIAFISDGNYNVGANPVYAAEKIALTPIFSLAVGDTIPKRDLLIRNVSANDIAFLNNQFPVEVDLESFKMGNKATEVELLHDGKKIGSTTVHFSGSRKDFQQVSFTVLADKPGFQRYTVRLKGLAGEYTLKNNERTFYIEVVDARSKVVLLAAAPHPDVAALKDVLDENENIETESVLIKDWNKNIEKVDLVIWHEPGLGYDPSIQSLLESKKIPVFYIIGPNSSAGVVNKLPLGITIPASPQTDELQASLNNGFNSFELPEKLDEAIRYFPPLKSKFGNLKIAGDVEVLLFQRIGTIRKNDPLLFFRSSGTTRNGILYGEGLWRWKLNDFVRNGNHDNFKELFGKVFNYLLVKRQGAGLHVEFPKRFTIDEEVIVNASFYNASLEPITKPSIAMKITDEKGKTYQSQFGVLGTGYKLSLGKLKAGKYRWAAKTSWDGKNYEKKGVFVVEDIQIEKAETAANHGVMKQLADMSGGKFYELKNYVKLLAYIEKRGDITTVSVQETSFDDLIEYWWYFVLLFLTMASEWFLRRYYGGY